MTTPAQRLAMAKAIIDFEARRDKAGHLAVYHLPANDGGGRYEVAGINEKYDGPAVRKLVDLLDADRYSEAEAYAQEYIAENTDIAGKWTSVPSIESYLRDSVFNRGAHGAARIMQRALGVDDDGDVGPITRGELGKAEAEPDAFLVKLRRAREDYERHVVGYRANFWRGLVNRWNEALEVARGFE